MTSHTSVLYNTKLNVVTWRQLIEILLEALASVCSFCLFSYHVFITWFGWIQFDSLPYVTVTFGFIFFPSIHPDQLNVSTIEPTHKSTTQISEPHAVIQKKLSEQHNKRLTDWCLCVLTHCYQPAGPHSPTDWQCLNRRHLTTDACRLLLSWIEFTWLFLHIWFSFVASTFAHYFVHIFPPLSHSAFHPLFPIFFGLSPHLLFFHFIPCGHFVFMEYHSHSDWATRPSSLRFRSLAFVYLFAFSLILKGIPPYKWFNFFLSDILQSNIFCWSSQFIVRSRSCLPPFQPHFYFTFMSFVTSFGD